MDDKITKRRTREREKKNQTFHWSHCSLCFFLRSSSQQIFRDDYLIVKMNVSDNIIQTEIKWNVITPCCPFDSTRHDLIECDVRLNWTQSNRIAAHRLNFCDLFSLLLFSVWQSPPNRKHQKQTKETNHNLSIVVCDLNLFIANYSIYFVFYFILLFVCAREEFVREFIYTYFRSFLRILRLFLYFTENMVSKIFSTKE